MLKFRRYQNFQNNTPKHIKNLDEFPYWSNNSEVSIWSVLIYSVARTIKSDPIKNKLLKILHQILGIDVSGMFVDKKRDSSIIIA